MSVITTTPSAAPSLSAAQDAASPDQILDAGTQLTQQGPDEGASTVEYAIILLAAAAFAGVLAAVIASDAVSDILLEIVKKALSF